MSPLDLMLRDADAAPDLLLIVVLPTLLAIPALRRGSRVAFAAPAALLVLLVAWYSYYALGWAEAGLGLRGPLLTVLGLTAVGLVGALVGLARVLSRGRRAG
ncbi:hypothetical protein [Nocardioides bruguierae]|uniref:Uncharacterized protein n=1 Tax=Nocardioides bruguierae TaxID=2945102 RepID=A0A9X2D4Z9_9ACTN|nr:hypothetical protein [Nocardioides bruguierae]MCM0619395.1 hypothetical protein [Nocardioides bruguierae]